MDVLYNNYRCAPHGENNADTIWQPDQGYEMAKEVYPEKEEPRKPVQES